jgi:two-component system sensor histidine kinase KdpD
VSRLIEYGIESSMPLSGGHAVSVRIPDALPKVDADPVWIHKVMGNLLENAAKYSPDGEPIFLSAERREGFVAISVADRGFGIDPMEQSLIFDKFYRARNRSESTSGTGMGLAICRAIVETHGGTIGVTSQIGHGSVFTFTLKVSGA